MSKKSKKGNGTRRKIGMTEAEMDRMSAVINQTTSSHPRINENLLEAGLTKGMNRVGSMGYFTYRKSFYYQKAEKAIESVYGLLCSHIGFSYMKHVREYTCSHSETENLYGEGTIIAEASQITDMASRMRINIRRIMKTDKLKEGFCMRIHTGYEKAYMEFIPTLLTDENDEVMAVILAQTDDEAKQIMMSFFQINLKQDTIDLNELPHSDFTYNGRKKEECWRTKFHHDFKFKMKLINMLLELGAQEGRTGEKLPEPDPAYDETEMLMYKMVEGEICVRQCENLPASPGTAISVHLWEPKGHVPTVISSLSPTDLPEPVLKMLLDPDIAEYPLLDFTKAENRYVEKYAGKVGLMDFNKGIDLRPYLDKFRYGKIFKLKFQKEDDKNVEGRATFMLHLNDDDSFLVVMAHENKDQDAVGFVVAEFPALPISISATSFASTPACCFLLPWWITCAQTFLPHSKKFKERAGW